MKLKEVWKGGVRRSQITCRKGLPKGGVLLMFCMRLSTQTMLDPSASATPISVQNSHNVQENVNKSHKEQIIDTGQVQNDPEDPTDQVTHNYNQNVQQTQIRFKDHQQEKVDQGTEVQNMGTGQIQHNTDPLGKATTGNLQDQNEAQMKTPNNKSQGKMNNDEYNVVLSEDEFDQDTQSLGENNNEEDKTSIHLIKAFGSTQHQEELQEVTDQQGLSPRGILKSKQAINNTSANSSRPNTRSRSRDQVYINSYRIELSMDQACSNQNGKIWNAHIQCQILENEDQHITCELNHVE
ncbi:hypothetical protein KY285_015006 [Solanum tuberosum]|nr:hypothetical protein KY285_015006 [Solanum tuberosum]